LITKPERGPVGLHVGRSLGSGLGRNKEAKKQYVKKLEKKAGGHDSQRSIRERETSSRKGKNQSGLRMA